MIRVEKVESERSKKTCERETRSHAHNVFHCGTRRQLSAANITIM